MTGQEMRQLADAVLSAFSTDDLRQLTQYDLGFALDNVVGPGPLGRRVFELIEYTEQRGVTPDLVAAVVEARPNRDDIQRMYRTAVLGAATPADPAAARDYGKVFKGRSPVVVQKAGGVEAVAAPDESGLQKTIRADNAFLPAANWARLFDRAQARVCRVELNDNQARMGTGFLVGPDALLTAYHVLEPVVRGEVPAGGVVFRFDYQFRPDGSVGAGVAVGLAGADEADRPWLLAHAPYSAGERDGRPDDPPAADDLDYALVRLARPVGAEARAGEPRGWVAVPPDQPAVAGLSTLLILQHPARRPLELAYDTAAGARLVLGGRRVRYATNTAPGSSGAPVFDHHWTLLALHHYGDPSWKRPEYNQGVPVGLVRAHLDRAPAAAAALGGPA